MKMEWIVTDYPTGQDQIGMMDYCILTIIVPHTQSSCIITSLDFLQKKLYINKK